jgi:type IV secretion system protein VirB4
MIETLTFSIAGLGILLIVLLLSLITKTDKARKLSKHRSKAASVADLLNYAALVDDGIIVGKDGSFLEGVQEA